MVLLLTMDDEVTVSLVSNDGFVDVFGVLLVLIESVVLELGFERLTLLTELVLTVVVLPRNGILGNLTTGTCNLRKDIFKGAGTVPR